MIKDTIGLLKESLSNKPRWLLFGLITGGVAVVTIGINIIYQGVSFLGPAVCLMVGFAAPYGIFELLVFGLDGMGSAYSETQVNLFIIAFIFLCWFAIGSLVGKFIKTNKGAILAIVAINIIGLIAMAALGLAVS